MQVPFCELQSNFTSCKFILRVGNKITNCKLLFASWELLFASCKFKEKILRVANSVLWVENLKIYITSWKFKMKKITSWNFKMIMFTSCEVAFYKLNIYGANFPNYHHMVESNFKSL